MSAINDDHRSNGHDGNSRSRKDQGRLPIPRHDLKNLPAAPQDTASFSSGDGPRLGAPRFCRAHRRVASLIDLDHEPARVTAANEPSQAFGPAGDDRVGVGPGLDSKTLGNLLVKEGVERLLPSAHRVDSPAIIFEY